MMQVKLRESCNSIIKRCFSTSHQTVHSSPLYGHGHNTKPPKTAVLLMNLGGPETTNHVTDFLTRLFSDRDIIKLPFQKFLGPMIAKFRTKKIQHHYKSIGGGSPIKKWTSVQGHEMIKKLDEISPETGPHQYYIAFRYAEPLTETALKHMEKDGVKRVIAFTQYPQWSCTTTGSSLNELWRCVKKLGMENTFEWSIIDRWNVHDGFVNAIAERIREGLEKFPAEVRKEVKIIFSAHSIPMAVVYRGDAYPKEVASTVHEVMDKLKYSNPYILSWQSAVGPSQWLGPQTVKVVSEYGKKGIDNLLVVPIAFTSDHIETLQEIDMQIKDEAQKAGIKHFKRAPSLNDSKTFTNAMADIVASHLKNNIVHSNQYKLRCPGCVNEDCRQIINPIKV